ncbi:MAG: exosome complex RNA-binding protein Csl4 [Candidatus Thorarchaeota archaeon]
MADVKSGDIVVPGDRLCVIEELSPSFGTYENEGVVYAATSGGVTMDLKDRCIMVLSPSGQTKLPLVTRDDIVVGEVRMVFESRAEILLVKRNDINMYNPIVGQVYIANVTRRFVKSMHDVLQPCDIVRAIALNTHQIPVQLSLVGPDLGVQYAKCRKCGGSLAVTVQNNMFCLRCEDRSTREVTRDYGLMFGLEPRPDLAPRRRSYDDRRDGDRYSRGSGRDDNRRYGSRRDSRDSGRGGDRRGRGDRRHDRRRD